MMDKQPPPKDSNIKEVEKFKDEMQKKWCDIKHQRWKNKDKFARQVTIDTFEKLYSMYTKKIEENDD